MKVVLNSVPTVGLHLDHISKENSFPPLPSTSSGTGIRKSSRLRRNASIFGQTHIKKNFVALHPESKADREVLEVDDSNAEPKVEKAYDHLLEAKEENKDSTKIESNKAFQEAAKLYFEQREDRRSPPKQSASVLGPPPLVPDAETVTQAAVLASSLKSVTAKRKSRKKATPTKLEKKGKTSHSRHSRHKKPLTSFLHGS